MMLCELLNGRKLILASRSPRRRELISGCGLDFNQGEDYHVDEAYPEGMVAGEVPGFLSRLKSEAYPRLLESDEILITADTVVILEGKIFGKPKDREDAVRMLSELSGRKHTVVTGVTIRSCDRQETFSVASDVWFRPLRTEEIEYYVDTFKPFDKAGAYGIQEWIGFAAVERIEGSFYNVMGLPVQALYVRLEKFLGA